MQELLEEVELKVNHIYREGIKVTDAISKFQDFEHFIWWDIVPDFILSIAENDRFMEYFRIT